MGAHISVPMYQRAIPQRYRLVAHRCKLCGGLNFPPKGVCKFCRKSFEFEEVALSGRGTVYTYTVIAGAGAPPEFTDQARAVGAYPVAVVQLDEGPRVIGQVVGASADCISIGLRVEAVVRRVYEEEGVIRYGFKFRPVWESSCCVGGS